MRGLEIIVNEKLLDTYLEISIPHVKLNPAFNEIGSHTLDFLIPWSDNNKLICGFPNRLTNEFKTELAAIVLFNGVTFFSGTLIIKSSNDKSGSGYISLDEGDYYYLISKLNMKDVNYGNDIEMGTTSQEVANYATATIIDTYPTVNFNFPLVYNPEFYGSENPDFSHLMNTMDVVGFSEVFVPNTINKNPIRDNVNCLVPFLYLYFIMAKILYHLNLKPLGTFWTNEDLKTILLYNNYPLDRSEKKYYVRATSTMINFIHYGLETVTLSNDSSFPNEDIDGVFDNTGGTARYSIASRGYHEFTFNFIVKCAQVGSPPLGSWDFYIYIKETLGNTVIWQSETYQFQSLETKTLTDIATFYVTEPQVGYYLKVYCKAVNGDSFEVNSGSWLKIKNTSYCSLNRYQNTLKYANHVPDISVKDFIKNVEKFFGFVSFVDMWKREHLMLSYKDMFTAALPEANDITKNVLEGMHIEYEVFNTKQSFAYNNDGFADNNFLKYNQFNWLGEFASYTDLPNIDKVGQAALVLNTNNVWVTKVSADGESFGWVLYTDNWLELSTGVETDPLFEIKAEAGPMLMQNFYLLFGIIPRIKNPATSEVFNTGQNEAPIRFMFYNGIKQNLYDKSYPQASSFSDSGILNLTTESINENFLGKHVEWLTRQHQIITFPAIFTPSEIRNLKMWEKYQVGNVIGFIKSVKTNLKKDKLDICTVEFLPI